MLGLIEIFQFFVMLGEVFQRILLVKCLCSIFCYCQNTDVGLKFCSLFSQRILYLNLQDCFYQSLIPYLSKGEVRNLKLLFLIGFLRSYLTWLFFKHVIFSNFHEFFSANDYIRIFSDHCFELHSKNCPNVYFSAHTFKHFINPSNKPHS